MDSETQGLQIIHLIGFYCLGCENLGCITIHEKATYITDSSFPFFPFRLCCSSSLFNNMILRIFLSHSLVHWSQGSNELLALFWTFTIKANASTDKLQENLPKTSKEKIARLTSRVNRLRENSDSCPVTKAVIFVNMCASVSSTVAFSSSKNKQKYSRDVPFTEKFHLRLETHYMIWPTFA